MHELDNDDMFFDNSNNEQHDQYFHQHQAHHHDSHDEVPPTSTGNPPQLGESIRSHANRCECQSRQNIGEGGDEGGGGGGGGNGYEGHAENGTAPLRSSHCMLPQTNDDDDWCDLASDTDSLKHDEGLEQHEVERPRYERHWIEVAGRPTMLTDIFRALAQHFHCSCHHHRMGGILPSPDGFTSAMNSPSLRHSGMHSPSPTDSMLVEPSGSGWQSTMSASSVHFSHHHHVIRTPGLLSQTGAAFDAAFPPLTHFHAGGPLWMGEEPTVGRRGGLFSFSPPEFGEDGGS